MYNKLFTKILDSSIWLAPTPTRIVWVTLLAAMDEDGFCAFASAANVARRAVVPVKDAVAALETLESPDPHSSDPENEGRRLERVDGGWMVLNAVKYREMATREVIRERTKERVRRYRDAKKRPVTLGNAEPVTCNAPVTQSEQSKADTDQSKSEYTQELARVPVVARSWPKRSPSILANACHPKCDRATWGACARGMCIPYFVVQAWRLQLGDDAHAQITAFVDATMAAHPEGVPFGDDPLKYWRGKWSERHGTALRGDSKGARIISEAQRAVELIEARQAREAAGLHD